MKRRCAARQTESEKKQGAGLPGTKHRDAKGAKGRRYETKDKGKGKGKGKGKSKGKSKGKNGGG